MLLNYDDNDYSQGYGWNKEAFGALTEGDILPPYIFDHDFRSWNRGIDDNNVGYKLCFSDRRYQKNSTIAQTIKVEFNFDGVVPVDKNGYALVLKNNLISVTSDAQRFF